MRTIVQASTPEQIDRIRSLLRAFVDWHRQRHTEDIELINRYFDAREFEEELATLPGLYALPKGRLLLAQEATQAVGCVALRDLGGGICEMKRMFIPVEFRGRGIGRTLADHILRDAKIEGYTRMRLDTSIRQTEAIGLYKKLGFKQIDPYYDLPNELRDWLVFMELRL